MDASQFNAATLAFITESAPRRRLLGGLLGGALTGALAVRGLEPAVAQGATPPAGSVPPILRAWAAAWSAHDAGVSLARLYTGDATHEEVPSGTVFRGPAAIAGYARSHFAAFPDVRLDLRSGFAAGDWAAAEWVYGGAYTGSLPGLPPGTGRRFSVRGAAIFELQGEKIRRSASYFDFYTLLVQLGVLPAPEAAATPTS
jgi:steroid delta-isomerase-like uncharacterized protein